MTQLDIGPVVGQIGGRVEVITEEVTVAGESRTWVLPDGWEAGVIGAEGIYDRSYSPGICRVFGVLATANAGDSSASNGFQSLDRPAVITVEQSDHSWSGTVSLIRTA